MATERQSFANRLNAARSTGPNTEAGKARSSRNALKHGLTGSVVTLPGEDAEAFDALKQSLIDEFALSGELSVLAYELIEQLAATLWRQRRIPVIEAAIFRAVADAVEERQEVLPDLRFSAQSIVQNEKLTADRTWDAIINRTDSLGKITRYETALSNKAADLYARIRKVQDAHIVVVNPVKEET